MDHFKAFAFLLTLCFVLTFGQDTNVIQDKLRKVYIKAVLCNASSQFIHKNYSCFAKSYNRQLSTVNVYGLTKKPLNDLFVHYNSLNTSF